MVRGTISAALVQPVVAFLPPTAEARDAFFRATDLTAQIVADPDARLSPAQFCVAWAELVRLTREPHIALRMAESIPVGAFGIVEYVCRCARTLGDGLRQWVRYLNLLDDAVVVGLVEEDDVACIRVLEESEAPAPASHELCFALLVAQARAISQWPLTVARVDLAHRARGDVRVYERWFGAPVRFDAPATQLVLPAGLLDSPLVTADPRLGAILQRTADEQLATDRGAPPLIAQVRKHVAARLQSEEATIEEIARQLGMTPRSLQRRLKDEGSSFQEVRDQVMRELATRYLDDDLSIAEISFLLGFSQPSAFFRAFKRWTGITPLESRARKRA